MRARAPRGGGGCVACEGGGREGAEGLQPRWPSTAAMAPVAEKKRPIGPYPGEIAGESVRTGWWRSKRSRGQAKPENGAAGRALDTGGEVQRHVVALRCGAVRRREARRKEARWERRAACFGGLRARRGPPDRQLLAVAGAWRPHGDGPLPRSERDVGARGHGRERGAG
jgi:hypothetical protein